MGRGYIQQMALIVLCTILVVSFQNCYQNGFNSSQSFTSSSSDFSSSTAANDTGSGTPYDGKIIVSAPTAMSNGQTVEIVVQGGAPPYSISSTAQTGQFVEVSPGVYEFTLGENESAPSVNINVSDSLGNTGAATIQIWGVNKWFFETPRGLATDGAGNLLVIEGERPSLTRLSLDGDVLDRWTLESVVGLDLSSPQEVVFVGEQLALISEGESTLYGLNLTTSSLSFKMEDSSNALWNGCGGLKDMKAFGVDEFAVLCETHLFFLDSDGNLQGTLNIKTSDNRPAGAFSFNEDESQIFVAKNDAWVTRFDLSGSELGQFRIRARNQSYMDGSVPRQLQVWSGNRLIYTNDEAKYGKIQVYNYLTDTGDEPNWKPGQDVTWSDMWGVALLADGGFATVESHSNNILIYDQNMDLKNRYGRRGDGDFFFKSITDVEITNDMITVLDRSNDRLVLYSRQGQFVREITTPYEPPAGEGRLRDAIAFGVDSKGLIYTVNWKYNAIDVYDTDGFVTRLSNGQGTGNLQLDNPRDLVIHNDLIYIADGTNKRILVWTLDGQFVRKFRAWGQPQSVSIVDDRFYIQELYGNSNIQVHNWDGTRIRAFENPMDFGYGTYFVPEELVHHAKSDQFLRLDKFHHRIFVYSRDGRFLKTVGQRGWGIGEFNTPQGISVDADGNVFVADTVNARLQILPAYLFQE